MRPRIGITTSTLPRAPEGDPSQVSAAVHLSYARCIAEAGGLPLLLPTLAPDFADATVASLDGLLLSGGGDLNSACWDEPLHPNHGLIDDVRDAVELALVRAALRCDLPLLGICRGVQVLAVATGGDLWQDIPTQCPGSLSHRGTGARSAMTHTVRVAPDSLLARVLWPQGAPPVLMDAFPVNSFHHQAPRNCGTLSAPVASSADGIIEALAVPDATFALGVQWHPEEMAACDARHASLFTALVHAASAHCAPYGG